jgi:hypothetical protein
VAIMVALKAATAEHHERLERRVDIASRLRSRAAYGDERLRDTFRALRGASADQIAGGIHAATVEHAGSTDDLAILVVRQLS